MTAGRFSTITSCARRWPWPPRLGCPVIQHAEDTKISHGNPMNEGVTSFKLGLRGQPAASEWQMVERDIRLASQEGGRLHVAHVSTAKSLDMVRLGRASQVNVTAEVTPHHFLFTEESCADYDTRYKMNPPLRSAADRAAMLAGLVDGTIDAIATDHAPHALYEKEVEFDKAAFGITGLEIALAAAITALHHTGKISLRRIVELLSTNPAKIVGLTGRGTLAEGSIADVTIFDPKKRGPTTWRRPARVRAIVLMAECSSTVKCAPRLSAARLCSTNCKAAVHTSTFNMRAHLFRASTLNGGFPGEFFAGISGLRRRSRRL